MKININVSRQLKLENKNVFFCGDVHGNYDLLMQCLSDADFDFDDDVAVMVGDLIDRGPDSEKCLRLLERDNFYSVIGNHELMLISGQKDDVVRQYHKTCGGDWLDDYSDDEIKALCDIVTSNMTVSITAHTSHGKVGVIHADTPVAKWKSIESADISEELLKIATWSFQMKDEKVRDVDLVVLGHLGLKSIESRSNKIWIDTLRYTNSINVMSDKKLFQNSIENKA